MTIQDLLQKLHSWEMVVGYSEGELNMLRACIEEIESYAESQCESAQGDCISRQAAIDALKRARELFCKNQVEFKVLSFGDKSRVDEIDNCISKLLGLPSAYPDIAEKLKFFDYLVDFVIDPNRMEIYRRMYNSTGEKIDG